MAYDPRRHHRRTTRLKGHDYTTPGAYFVTICTHNREYLLGEIIDGVVRLSEYGQIVAAEWARAVVVRPDVSLDAWVVMPNHIHGIIIINDHVGAGRRPAPTDAAMDPHLARRDRPTPTETPSNPTQALGVKPGSIGAIMAQFKSVVTKRINALRSASRAPIWQRGYYDHIIRNDGELTAIRRYIHNNPQQWSLDRDNLANLRRLAPPAHIDDYLVELSSD